MISSQKHTSDTTELVETKHHKFHVKDPGSALTHFIAMIGAVIAAVPLLHKAAGEADSRHLAALAVFIVSMILLYAASTTYHTFNISEHVNKILRKIDHMMIFILIAGTYTPVCLIVLGNNAGYRLLALVWGIAIAGILVNALWINCPKWFSSLVYIAMGWICVLAFRQIVLALPKSAFLWLLTGGLIYTAGGIIYALKLPIFNATHKNFGSHEIFHLFVMGGSLCHYVDDVRICSMKREIPISSDRHYASYVHEMHTFNFLCHIHSPFEKGTVLMPVDRLTQAVPFQFIKSV